MPLKKAKKKIKRSVKKVTKTAKSVVKTGINTAQKALPSTLKNVKKLLGLKRKKRRSVGYEGTAEDIAKIREFKGEGKQEERITISDSFSGLCFNGTKSNFNFYKPQCYDFDDNFIHFSSNISEKYDTDSDEFIDLDITNSFVDPTKKYPIKTIGTKYVGSGIAGLATGGKTCDDIECVAKPNLCQSYIEGDSESSITNRVYEFNNITWIRRDNMPDGVAFHTGVGDEDHAIFWGGLHASIEAANIQTHIPGCDNWKDIINAFQGEFFEDGIYDNGNLKYSVFRDSTETNYGVTFTPIQSNTINNNFVIYDPSLVNEFDLNESLDRINSGDFSIHSGKLEYTSYISGGNVSIHYDSNIVDVPIENYPFSYDNICNLQRHGHSKNLTGGVLLSSYSKTESHQQTTFINHAINQEKFSSPVVSHDPSNVAFNNPLEDFWEVDCILGECECECSDDAWIQYDFEHPIKLYKYEITSEISDSDYTPREWILAGSDNPTANKQDWDTLDYRSVDIWADDISGNITRNFEIQTPRNYKYYRIFFEKSFSGSIRINRLQYLSYINPSVWLWSVPYNQSGHGHTKTTEDFYIQPSEMVSSGKNLEVVKSNKKQNGGARISRAIMAGPESSGIGMKNKGISTGFIDIFNYGDEKKSIDLDVPTDDEINSSFPWAVIGDRGILGPTGFVEMIDSSGNYWVAFGDSKNVSSSQFKDTNFINKYTIIRIPYNKINIFQKTILAHENFRHSNIQVNGFLSKDWTDLEIDVSTGTYVTLLGARNREGFQELLDTRIGDEFFDIYIDLLDYNVTSPNNYEFTNKEINNPDIIHGTFNINVCESYDNVTCSNNHNYYYINKDSVLYPIIRNELVSPKDADDKCEFCSLEDVLVIDPSGNPITFDIEDAPKWKQHNHTEWATSYLESPFSGPFSRDKFNVWLTAGQDPSWGNVLWSSVDKGDGWMHFRQNRYSISGDNLVYSVLRCSFVMNSFVGSYRTIPTYFTYDEFIFDLEYYKPLKEIRIILDRDDKELVTDDTLLTYVNPNIFIYCSESKEIDLDNVFSREAISQKNFGRENSIDVNYLEDVSGGVGFHSQSPFKFGPIEDDVIIYSGSLDNQPFVLSGEITIVRGDPDIEPEFPFKSEDIVFTTRGGFSISEFGVNTEEISGTELEIPSEDNEKLFDETVESSEDENERLKIGQRLILARYRRSFGRDRTMLSKRYPWITSYLEKETPVYADFNDVSDRQRVIIDKYKAGNRLQKSYLLKRHPWLKTIKSQDKNTTDPSSVSVSRNKRSRRRSWKLFRRQRKTQPEPEVIETPPITSDDYPLVLSPGEELFQANQGETYWVFLGLPDDAKPNSYNIYIDGKMYYTPVFNDVRIDLDPDAGYTEWITSFTMEYKKREELGDGEEKKYYYRYDIRDRGTNTLLENEELNNTNNKIIETDWKRFQDGVGLGGSSVPILNRRSPSDINCTKLASCPIGSVAFGNPDQSIICGGYSNETNGILLPTKSWWGLLTDSPTFKWNRFVINPEDSLNKNYMKRSFSPFYANDEQTLSDTIHSCILFDTSRPQTFERHGQIIFEHEKEKEVMFDDFPEYVTDKDKYSISLLPTGNVKVWWSGKEENKFTINTEIDWSGIIDWKIVKVTDIPTEEISNMDIDDTFERYEDQ